MYRIVRHYYQHPSGVRRRVVKRVSTEQAAQLHCSNPEMSSRTCTRAEGKRRTKRVGPWFEGYEECDR